MVVLAQRVLGGVDRTGQRPFCGHFVPESGVLILESNLFPVVSDWFSLSFHISARSLDEISPAQITYGLVGFDSTYTETTYYSSDHFPQYRIISKSSVEDNITFLFDTPHVLSPGEQVLITAVEGVTDGLYLINYVAQNSITVVSLTAVIEEPTEVFGFAVGRKYLLMDGGTEISGYLNLKGLYQAPADTPEMCFRLEVANCATFWLDNILVDPHEGQYDYFDGHSVDSFPEDYRWMGDRENRHFSLWYNNYKNTHNRLFSDWDTEEQVYKSGLVEEWAPTGSNIVDHWDAVTSFTPLNWDGPAYYPLHEGSTVGVATIDTRLDADGSTLPA